MLGDLAISDARIQSLIREKDAEILRLRDRIFAVEKIVQVKLLVILPVVLILELKWYNLHIVELEILTLEVVILQVHINQDNLHMVLILLILNQVLNNKPLTEVELTKKINLTDQHLLLMIEDLMTQELAHLL
jgi:hypothetical protein